CGTATARRSTPRSSRRHRALRLNLRPSTRCLKPLIVSAVPMAGKYCATSTSSGATVRLGIPLPNSPKSRQHQLPFHPHPHPPPHPTGASLRGARPKPGPPPNAAVFARHEPEGFQIFSYGGNKRCGAGGLLGEGGGWVFFVGPTARKNRLGAGERKRAGATRH